MAIVTRLAAGVPVVAWRGCVRVCGRERKCSIGLSGRMRERVCLSALGEREKESEWV